MRYRKTTAYVLAIHGCPCWPVVGIASSEVSNMFTDFVADGGTFENCLSVPSVSQVLDATGGFSRLSDTSYEFINSDSFTQFFGANRIDNTYTYLTESLSYSATSATVADTSEFTAGDDAYLPRETILIDSVDTGTSLTVSRSRYSAFVEGRASTYCAVPVNAIQGPAVVLGGHFNLNGRWVCLYKLTKDMVGEWSSVRVYAGVISQVDYSGRKISLQTKSITSLFSSPILQEAFFTLAKPTELYIPSTMYIVNKDGATMAELSTGTYSDICETLKNSADTKSILAGNFFIHDIRPSFFWIQASYTTYPDENDCPSTNDNDTSLALQKYFCLLDTPVGSAGIGWNCSTQPANSNKYDFILVGGSQFNFKEDIYNTTAHINNQYFYFENAEGEKAIIPCSWSVGVGCWVVSAVTATPWFDADGNFIDHAFVGHSETTKVKPVISLSTGTATDILYLMNQILISTGEDIAPSEDGELGFYQSLGIPYYLIDSDSFQVISYYVKPVVHDSKTLMDIFEPSLKIAGYSIIFGSDGRIKVKQNALAAEGSSIGTYTLAQVSTEKPSVATGYQVPLTNMTIKLSNLNKTYSFNMEDPQAAFAKGNELALTDEIATQEYYYTAAVAYNNLYWLSNIIPSAVVTVDEIVGEVGDCVKVTNKYILAGTEYGITDRLAIQTEITTGAENQARFLLAGNLDLSNFAMLAPAGRLDTAIGDKGLSNERLYFTSEFDNGLSFVQFLYKYLGSTGPFVFCAHTTYSYTNIMDCYLDINNDCIQAPGGFCWPSGFATTYQDVDYYVTLGDYYLAGV